MTRGPTLAMQEDPKTVLRGVLTYVGEGDNFGGHGGAKKISFIEGSDWGGSETLCCSMSSGSLIFPRPLANFGSHVSSNSVENDYFSSSEYAIKYTNTLCDLV